VTFRLFRDEEVHAKNKIIIDQDESTGLPKHIYVKDIVREKDMFYYRVPRLGSYLAIKLEYDSCLNEEAYDAAVENYIEVDQLNFNQEEERKAWEEEQAELAKARAEAIEEGEEEVPYEPEERDWTPYEYAPFQTQKVQFAVCLNTMGQDREFTEEERLYALSCVKHYRERWETIEDEQLRRDIEYKIASIKPDREYQEHFGPKDTAEMDRRLKEAVAQAAEEKTAEGEDMTSADKEAVKK